MSDSLAHRLAEALGGPSTIFSKGSRRHRDGDPTNGGANHWMWVGIISGCAIVLAALCAAGWMWHRKRSRAKRLAETGGAGSHPLPYQQHQGRPDQGPPQNPVNSAFPEQQQPYPPPYAQPQLVQPAYYNNPPPPLSQQQPQQA